MLEQEFTIVNKLGLHARASALLVKNATRFHSEIRIEREGVEVNGKSIMGIMMLAAAKGSTIRVEDYRRGPGRGHVCSGGTHHQWFRRRLTTGSSGQ